MRLRQLTSFKKDILAMKVLGMRRGKPSAKGDTGKGCLCWGGEGGGGGEYDE